MQYCLYPFKYSINAYLFHLMQPFRITRSGRRHDLLTAGLHKQTKHQLSSFDREIQTIDDSNTQAIADIRRLGILGAFDFGTFAIEGATNSGKNRLLEYIIKFNLGMCQQPDKIKTFTDVITVSSTEKINKALKKVVNLVTNDENRWYKATSLEEFVAAIDARKQFLETKQKILEKIYEEEEAEIKYQQWLKDNPILIIVDDFGGTEFNFSNSKNNPLYNLISCARYYGCYMFLLFQYSKGIGPAFYNNCMAVLSFDANESALKVLSSCYGMTKLKNYYEKLLRHMKTKHSCTLWVNYWGLEYKKPLTPLLIDPVDETKRFIIKDV